jgi:hypothetical protein
MLWSKNLFPLPGIKLWPSNPQPSLYQARDKQILM